jgi:hypothetical protein
LEIHSSALKHGVAVEDIEHAVRNAMVTDELDDDLRLYVGATRSASAEEGFDVDEILRRRGGRPPMGAAAASVESVRLDPALSQALRQRAEQEGRTNSDLIRAALRRYLQAS